MMRACRTASAALCIAVAFGTAHALPADQIFDRVAPGVWSVKAYSADEKLLASASGVVVAPGKLVTSCQVLARARQVQLRRGNTIFDAKLEFPDVERDLCQLDVPGLAAPAPAVGAARALRPGQRLYVVGFGRGNEQSIGEGLVSVLADAGTGKERLQTTVSAAPGLRGAGVFDEEARLVGVVTSSPADAPATVFAVPAEWLAELATRGEAALAARAKPPAAGGTGSIGAAAPGLPTAGTSWVYSLTDRLYGRHLPELTVRILRVDDAAVEEVLSGAVSDAGQARRAINSRETRFFEVRLAQNSVILEFAPYLGTVDEGKFALGFASAAAYPLGGSGLAPWVTKSSTRGWESITVPAGTFKALRMDISGERARDDFTNQAHAGKFKVSVWYAPDVKRFVRLEHWYYSGAIAMRGRLMGHDIIELLKYSPGA
jgi:hypothetical protein